MNYHFFSAFYEEERILAPKAWLFMALEAVLLATDLLPSSVNISYISNNFISAFASLSIFLAVCYYISAIVTSFYFSTSFNYVIVPSFSAY